ncbi:MAG: polymer-forming cytoskeletal protein [Bacteroidota bacterium]
MPKAATLNPPQVNMVGRGTHVQGDFTVAGDISVSGHITGTLKVEGRVTITKDGLVDGSLKAREADVAGQVKGKVDVEERLVLRGTARVDADIRTARLVVEEGALCNGTCTMGSKQSLELGTLDTSKVTPIAAR